MRESKGERTIGSAHQLKVQGLRVLVVIAILGMWLYLQGPGGVSRIILPELGAVVSAFWGLLASMEIYQAAAVTFAEVFAAIAICGPLGIALGFWGARTPLRYGVLETVLVSGYLVPLILFYPVLLLWLGFGMSSKIGYAALSAFFPIAFNALRAFRGVDPRYIQVGRAFGASPGQLDLLIKLRAGLPMAAAGLKLGAALCMITVVVAEMLSSRQGLGKLIQFYAQSFRSERTFAVIIVVMLVVGIFQFTLKKILREDAPDVKI